VFSKENRKKIISSLLAVIPALILGILFFMLDSRLTPKTGLPSLISPFDYLITEPFVIVQYFKNFLLPTELSADSDWQFINTIFDIRLLMGLMFITGMIWLAIRLSRNELFRPVSFGIFWFFIALLPSSSIFPLSEVLNDHRIFFPFIGLALSGTWTLVYIIILRNEKQFLSSFKLKFISILIISGIIIPHAYGTRQRNKVWNSYESLWYDVTKKSPNNGRGLMNYGLSQMQKGNYVIAKTYFERALKLLPNYPLLYINLGVLHTSLNDPIGAEQYFKKAISIGLYVDQSYYYYANFLYVQKRYDEAKLMLKNSIANNPAYIFSRFLLMSIYSETQDWGNLKTLAEETLNYLPNDQTCLNYIYAAKNKKSKLDITLETASKNPTAENYLNLSLNYYEAGKYNECVEACKKAINIKPDYALAYNNMCSAYNALKIYDKAIEACNKAIALQPDFELAKNNLKLAQSKK
jgi:tetratricopeptide (TPR) repeat protein